ncbi:Lrp/AsnC family transcriptional regulator [Candidatus Woesearchaeota archaeon]|nr:Lrp/AsnC family transcriptional regulator [Candidatus Woesearchaeota archaeon]
MKLKKKDLFILSHLRNNARITLTELGKKTNYPISTIHDRIKQIESAYVRKYTSLIDFNKLGYNTRVQLFLKTTPENRKELMSHLLYHQNVNTVLMVNDEYDFIVDGFFKNKKDFNQFVNVLKDDYIISKTRSIEVVDELKEESFFSDPQHFSESY